MKKIMFSLIGVLLIAGILVKTAVPAFVSAHDIQETTAPITQSSKAAYAMDADTKTVIYAHNENTRLPIASMVKIMTLLLCYEEIDNNRLSYDDNITVSQHAASMGGSQAFLDAGSEYKAGELIKSIVVSSANDSCVAMAEHICGSVEGFVDRMNAKAKELGMSNTNFVNCTGLPAENSYSCAKDVATMTAELIKHKGYFDFSKIWLDSIKHKDGRETELANTNKLVRFYNGCDGGKTGYTSEAGHCLSATAIRNNLRLIAVTIGAPDSKSRFAQVSSMLNNGFANYENKLLVSADKALDTPLKVSSGKKSTIAVKPSQNVSIFKAKNDELGSIEIVQNNYKVKAPVKEDDKVGEITVYKDGQVYKVVDLIAAESVEKMGYKDIVRKMFDRFI